MAIFEEIAKKYAEFVESEGANNNVANEIVRRIETLTYSKSGDPLSLEDKLKIVELTQRHLSQDEMLYKEADNKNYLQMVNHIINQLKGKDGK